MTALRANVKGVAGRKLARHDAGMADRPPSDGPALGKARLEPIFSTPIFRFDVPDHAALDARLIEEIAARRRAETNAVTARSSHRGGWHSAYDLFGRTEPAHRALAALFRKAFWTATREVTPQDDLAAVSMQANGWINVNAPGAFNRPHDHGEWFWSAVYYISCPAAAPDDPDGGSIEFVDGRGEGARRPPFPVPFLRRRYSIRPSAGDLILFPANLLHWVYPNSGDGDRVSAAANARFVAKKAGAGAAAPTASATRLRS